MKSFLRSVLINFFSLLLISKLTGAASYENSYVVLFWASFALVVLNLLVKPILNLILMPINILTLGAFRWIINIVVLFLVTVFVPQFKILSYDFPGLALGGFTIPAVKLAFFWALFLVSFLLELISSVFYWLIK